MARSVFKKVDMDVECGKFVDCYPLQNKAVEAVARSFVSILFGFAIPQGIAIYHRTEYSATSVLTETCKFFDIKQSNFKFW